jgi:hypothetical protein
MAPEYLSVEFVRCAKDCAFAIRKIENCRNKESNINETFIQFGSGQLGMVRNDDGDRWMITNKNVVCRNLKKVEGHATEVHSRVLASMNLMKQGSHHPQPFTFFFCEYSTLHYSIDSSNNLILRDEVQLNWGIDIAASKLNTDSQ